MKNIKIFHILIITITVLAASSGCNNDEKKPATLSSLFETLEKPLETTTFQADEWFVFTSQSGKTSLVIPYNSLVDEAGNLVLGEVKLEFREIYSKGDMVRYARPTQTIAGAPLESGGEVYLKLTKGDQTLRLGPGARVTMVLGTDNPVNDMDVFYGATNAAGQFGWEDDGTPDVPNVAVSVDSFNTNNYGYQFFSDSLEWVNCDRFLDIPDNQRTTACANLSEDFTVENTSVYLVYTDRNSVMQLWNVGTGTTFCSSGVPIGDAVTFVSLSVQGDEGEEVYFLAHEAATVTADLTVDLVPVETSIADIEAYLGGL